MTRRVASFTNQEMLAKVVKKVDVVNLPAAS